MGGFKNVKDHCPDLLEFNRLLDAAAKHAVTNWQINFVSSIDDNYEKFGGKMRLSDKQYNQLIDIAGW